MKIKLYLLVLALLCSENLAARGCAEPHKEIYTLYLENSKKPYISKEQEIHLAKCIITGNEDYLQKISSITPYSYKDMDGLTATSLQSEREDIINFLTYSNEQLREVIKNNTNIRLSTWLEVTRYMNSSAAYIKDFESMGINPGWAFVVDRALIPLLFDNVTITRSMILEGRIKQFESQND